MHLHTSSGLRLLAWLAAGSLLLVSCGDGDEPGGDAGADVAESVDAEWAQSAQEYRERDGERFEFVCPADGTPQTVWGTDTYTDDSSVCTAAVHHGLIDFGPGGAVVIEIREGEESYTGSERNGVSTFDYGDWPGSFVFP